MTRSPLWYLEKFGLLDGVSPEHQAQLAERARLLSLKRGEAIYEPGDASDHLFLVLRGLVKLVGTAPEGQPVLLAVLTVGDILGVLSVVDGNRRDHRAEAAGPALVCALPADLIAQIGQAAPPFAAAVNSRVGEHVRLLRARVQELLGKGAAARLAHTLLDLARRHGVPDAEGVLIPIPLTQVDLASLIGLTRETINSLIRQWREQGLIEMTRRSIRLRDPDRLGRVR